MPYGTKNKCHVAVGCATIAPMKHRPQTIWEVINIADFARKSGIPRRTLARIKAGGQDYPMSAATKVAIKHALSRYTQEKV